MSSCRGLVVLVAGACLTCALACTETPARPPAARPATWAQPLQAAGLPNLHKVSDTLYRGAQPEPQGFKSLRDLGVKTVVNLRLTQSDAEAIGDLPLAYHHIKVEAWDADRDEIVAFLKIATDPTQQPVFVHCAHGADRTGMMVAFYRIAVQGWSKADAIAEMTAGGFGHHAVWGNLVKTIEGYDVEKLRAAAGLVP